MQRTLRQYFEVIANSLVAIKITMTTIGIVSFGDVVNWIVEHWNTITRAIWREIANYFGLPKILNAEMDALTTIALFLPLGLVAFFSRNREKSTDNPTKYTAGAFLVFVAIILFVEENLQSCENIPTPNWALYLINMIENIYDTWIGAVAKALGPIAALSIAVIFIISFMPLLSSKLWKFCQRHPSLSPKIEKIPPRIFLRIAFYLKITKRLIFFVFFAIIVLVVLFLGMPLFLVTIAAGGLQLAALLCAFFALGCAAWFIPRKLVGIGVMALVLSVGALAADLVAEVRHDVEKSQDTHQVTGNHVDRSRAAQYREICRCLVESGDMKRKVAKKIGCL